ncbi:TIGR00282 family metallophosphoesterase [Allocoprobacillus halotolerans]|uniref:TIGR00282 family metallophosphoesterase n=1 Tax=Allocoprobacillus halotolerans TaxID=2944914 RepID=A0ABY5I0U9_9FIRM|nr:TIGR00282 family metallophosphoesterase [Allocoprobacillus halotolerans]UTY38974.1 TIGR00282 family metallophosphoesterase [Allocoprobacillus halotolerans]
MNILFIGDVFSAIGREMIERYLPLLKEKYEIDFVIANVENATHGKGLIKKHYNEFLFQGISFMTMGNHTFAKKELFDYIDEADRLIVPYNQPKALPGIGSREILFKNRKIRVTNLLGITFMDGKSQNPFEAIDDILAKDQSDIHIIDFHAEATSEKVALGYYLDGKVSAVLGTHTHVTTADEKILPKGTAYQSDVGMTGPYHSAIGCDVDSIIKRMKMGIMTPFQIAESEGQLRATLLTFNDQNQCTQIQRICIDPNHSL